LRKVLLDTIEVMWHSEIEGSNWMLHLSLYTEEGFMQRDKCWRKAWLFLDSVWGHNSWSNPRKLSLSNMSENYTTKATSKEYGIEMFYNLIYKAQLWAKLEVLSFTSLIEKALNRINQWFQFLVCSYRKHLIWKSMYKVGILQKSSLQIN